MGNNTVVTQTTCSNLFVDTTPFETTPYASPNGWSLWEGHPYHSIAIITPLSDTKHIIIKHLIILLSDINTFNT